MIRYLEINNFKSLLHFASPMSNLNLFFGLNGAGKSSVLQSLLLLRQSYQNSNSGVISGLFLNGSLINLGMEKDVLSQNALDEEIRINILFDDASEGNFHFAYGNNPPGNVIKRIALDVDECLNESLFSKDFYYLAAEHIGPQRQYDISMWNEDGRFNLGVHGEYVVPFLAIYGERVIVPEIMCLENAKSNRLIDQATSWMNLISPGVKLNADVNYIEQYSRLLISYESERLYSDAYSPVNVGFGIPYVLPIIVELLISGTDTLLLIENPESHLHPKGQTSIAGLIAKAAANGAQIMCESHSDHIINGIRVAVKEGRLNKDDLNILYFDKDESQNTTICPISTDSNGLLSDYPEGFLDEWGILMSQLL